MRKLSRVWLVPLCGGLFLGWLPDFSAGKQWPKHEKAVLLMITRHNYNGFTSCRQQGSNEMSGLELQTQKSTPSRPYLSHTSSRKAKTHTNRHASLWLQVHLALMLIKEFVCLYIPAKAALCVCRRTQFHFSRHTHVHRHTLALLVCSSCQLSPSACRLCVWHPG